MSNLEETVILQTAKNAAENRTQRATRIVLHILTESSNSLSGEKIWKAFQQQTAKNPAAFSNFKHADRGSPEKLQPIPLYESESMIPKGPHGEKSSLVCFQNNVG